MTNDDNTNDDKKTELLTWAVSKRGFVISADLDMPHRVRISTMAERDANLSIEDARELLTHALVHLGGGTDRADTAVAEVAFELCRLHADMRERAEKRLAALQEIHAIQARDLGDYMGRLKQYEGKD